MRYSYLTASRRGIDIPPLYGFAGEVWRDQRPTVALVTTRTVTDS